MSAQVAPDSTKREKDLTERPGCLIMLLATFLFAAERYILFVSLWPQSMTYASTTSQIHRFLFGDPPFSLFDVLLGFEIPDEGLLFLLQPHNLLLGLTQAIHFGMNAAVVYGPFWLYDRLRSASPRRRPPEPKANHALATDDKQARLTDQQVLDLLNRPAPLQLPGADLSGRFLPRVNLSGANLEQANLSSAHLVGADLSRTSLRLADLSNANPQGAHLDGANLSAADFGGANLAGATLRGAVLENTNLRGARLMNADLSGALLADPLADGADFSGAVLHGARFGFQGDYCLRGAVLKGTTMPDGTVR